MARRFTSKQRVVLYLASGGLCSECGEPLAPGWHGDHIRPWSRGGQTDVINGQALCPTCNLKKGKKMASERKARTWQTEAWRKWELDRMVDWLLCATPGAGKTEWALVLVRRLLDYGTGERVVVVAPTQTIRDQWLDQRHVNLTTVENANGGVENRQDFHGCVVTYAQVGMQPDLQRRACALAKTIVIFDEIHHAGDKRLWGDALRQAFDGAVVRIGMTGTPWRRPRAGKIPFVTYKPDESEPEKERVRVDFAYEYGAAVRDGVCRGVQFHAYDGEVKYVDVDSCSARTVTMRLGEAEEDRSAVLRDLLNPDLPWLTSMLRRAHETLREIRRGEDGEGAIPDAKGLIIVDNQSHAKKTAVLLHKLTGEAPELIISDEADAHDALERFKKSRAHWAVAVDMFSEGVDVPALFVGVYATRKKTPLKFRQIVGRFVRRRIGEERDAVLFMPAVPTLLRLAKEIEEELRQIVDEPPEKDEQPESDGLWDDEPSTPDLVPVSASDGALVRITRGGNEYTEPEYVSALSLCQRHGIPNTFAVNMIDALRDAGTPVRYVPSSLPAVEEDDGLTTHRLKKLLRKQIDRTVGRKAKALGMEKKELNGGLYNRFGAREPMSIPQLRTLLDYVEGLTAGGVAHEPA